MTEAADSYDTDGFAGTTAVLLQRREDGDTAAEHGCGVCGVETFGDVEDEMAVCAVMCCISTVRLSLVAWVHGAVSVDGFTMAMVLQALGAVGAIFLHAAAGLCANAYARAFFDMLHVLADFYGFADDFVADNAGYGNVSRLCKQVLNG